MDVAFSLKHVYGNDELYIAILMFYLSKENAFLELIDFKIKQKAAYFI